MKKFIYSLAVGLLMVLSACGNNAPETTQFNQITKLADGTLLYGTSAYTGTITSDDGKFLMVDVKKGKIKSIKAHHTNGQIAMETKEDGSFAYYDPNGNYMDPQMFYLNHGDIDEKVEACLAEMKLQ